MCELVTSFDSAFNSTYTIGSSVGIKKEDLMKISFVEVGEDGSRKYKPKCPKCEAVLVPLDIGDLQKWLCCPNDLLTKGENFFQPIPHMGIINADEIFHIQYYKPGNKSYSLWILKYCCDNNKHRNTQLPIAQRFLVHDGQALSEKHKMIVDTFEKWGDKATWPEETVEKRVEFIKSVYQSVMDLDITPKSSRTCINQYVCCPSFQEELQTEPLLQQPKETWGWKQPVHHP